MRKAQEMLKSAVVASIPASPVVLSQPPLVVLNVPFFITASRRARLPPIGIGTSSVFPPRSIVAAAALKPTIPQYFSG